MEHEQVIKIFNCWVIVHERDWDHYTHGVFRSLFKFRSTFHTSQHNACSNLCIYYSLLVIEIPYLFINKRNFVVRLRVINSKLQCIHGKVYYDCYPNIWTATSKWTKKSVNLAVRLISVRLIIRPKLLGCSNEICYETKVLLE